MKKLASLVKAFAGILLVLFLIFVAFDVFMRNVLRIPITWLNEGSTFAFMWMTFISGAVAFYEDIHYKISLFPEKIEKKVEKFLISFELLSVLTFGVVLFWQGIKYFKVNEMSFSPSLGLKMSNIVVVLPLCSLGIIIFACARAKKAFSPKIESSGDHK
jgi:TRAP-type C4-dicarboxylate transport system permease small subunit